MFKLTKLQRLRKPAEFQRVYRSKQWGGSQHYTFNVRAVDDAHDALEKLDDNNLNTVDLRPVLGVTVSKKVSKRAVDRNRIKRQVKEFFRQNQADLGIIRLVITAKPSCLKANDEQRSESLQELWAKILKWQRWHRHQSEKKQTIS